MESWGFCRRRRSHAFAVEHLEGRALLSTVATTAPFQVQPTGAQSAAVQHRIQQQQAQNRNANAGDALKVGKQYTKTLFSHTTGTVVSNYTKALLRGDGKDLKNLGNSNEVKQLSTSFKNVANSSQAQAVKHSLQSLGHSISHAFDKMFK